MTLQVAESWFEHRVIDDGVTAIWEPHVVRFMRCNIWLVRGRDRDMLIDSGMGMCSLRGAIEDLLEKPVLAVASHSHFDHIGSHHEFAERIAHAGEADILAAPSRENTLIEKYVDETAITALPSAGYDVAAYAIEPAPATRLVADGDVIELGDRAFEVLHLPGHSPGSIGLWEGPPASSSRAMRSTTANCSTIATTRTFPTTSPPWSACARCRRGWSTAATRRASAANA